MAPVEPPVPAGPATVMKQAIQAVLRPFGLGLHRVNPDGSPKRRPAAPHAQGFAVRSALDHNTRSRMDEYYADPAVVARYLNEERLVFYADCVELLEAHLGPGGLAGRRIADYGCGPGLLLEAIQRRAPAARLWGFDFSTAGLDVARAKVPGATLAARDLYQDYDDRFDVVLCTEVLEHLEYPERALRTLLAQVEPGGCLLLTVPNGRLDTFEGHINFWSLESWRIFVAQHAPGCPAATGLMRGYDGKGFLRALLTKPGR